jgi:superfamily I DNA/RNA helicase
MIFPTTEEFEVEMQQRKTVFYTIHSYKGMENQFIVVADVESLAEEKRKLLYVGMSRARVGLTVLAHENLRSEIEKLVSG